MSILNFAWTWQSCGHYLWCVKRPNIITWLNFSKGYRGGGSPVGWTKRVHKLLGLSCCSSLNFWLLIYYWTAFKFNIFYFLPLFNYFLIYCLSRALYRLRVLSLLQEPYLCSLVWPLVPHWTSVFLQGFVVVKMQGWCPAGTSSLSNWKTLFF